MTQEPQDVDGSPTEVSDDDCGCAAHYRATHPELTDEELRTSHRADCPRRLAKLEQARRRVGRHRRGL